MSDVLDFYSEWGAMTLEELDKLAEERRKLETASTIAPTDFEQMSPYTRMHVAAKAVELGLTPGLHDTVVHLKEVDEGPFFERLRKAMERTQDPINPSHYKQGSIELIDFIDDWNLNFYEGTIIQYLLRWRFKGGVQDLKKAKWYLDRFIAMKEDK